MPLDLQALRGRFERTFLGQLTRSFVADQTLDRSMVIASQAFTTLIPLLIVVSSLLPRGDPDAVADALTKRLRLSGDSAEEVQQIFGSSDVGSIGVVSALLLLFSGISFARRLQRMYQQVWRAPAMRALQASRSAVTGLFALVLNTALIYILRAAATDLPNGPVVTIGFALVVSALFWTLIPWLLLDRLVEWRRLLVGGLLTGVAVTVYSFATAFYMPQLIDAYSDRYGLFGVIISLVSWLLCVSFLVVASAVIAAEVDRAPQGWARALRSKLALEPLEESGHGPGRPTAEPGSG